MSYKSSNFKLTVFIPIDSVYLYILATPISITGPVNNGTKTKLKSNSNQMSGTWKNDFNLLENMKFP